MTKDEIFIGIQSVLAILNGDEAPEARGYLCGLIMGDHLAEAVPRLIAARLVQCDKPDPLPRVLLDFIEELLSSAEDDPDALNDLGALYYSGSRGFEQDYSKAVEYYKIAAEKGSRQAQENLGYCYYYGRNMPVDYEKAFHYFALGAFNGHLISLYKIGDMYQNGYYVAKNPVEAFHIYEHCIDTMTDEAAQTVAGPVFLRLGNAFLYGNGTEKNAKTALICYQKAEVFLYDMVAGGDVMYRKSLQAAIDGQAKAREALTFVLSGEERKYD